MTLSKREKVPFNSKDGLLFCVIEFLKSPSLNCKCLDFTYIELLTRRQYSAVSNLETLDWRQHMLMNSLGFC